MATASQQSLKIQKALAGVNFGSGVNTAAAKAKAAQDSLAATKARILGKGGRRRRNRRKSRKTKRRKTRKSRRRRRRRRTRRRR